MELLIGYLKAFTMQIGGGGSQIGKSRFVIERGRSKCTCGYNREGVKFFLFWCVRTT